MSTPDSKPKEGSPAGGTVDASNRRSDPRSDLLDLLGKIDAASDGRHPGYAEQLIKYVTSSADLGQPVAPRVSYNVACYYASRVRFEKSRSRPGGDPAVGDDAAAGKAAALRADKAAKEALVHLLVHLRLALEGVYGDERAAYINWAQTDPSLAPLRDDDDSAKEFKRLLAELVDPAELNPTVADGLGALRVIGPEGAEKLAKAGITSWRGLLHLTDKTAKDHEISEEQRQQWVAAAKLLEIVGIGIGYATLLHRAGIETRAQLAESDPKWLVEQLRNVNRDKPVVAHPPSRRTLKRWVAEARRLERQRDPKPR